MMSSAANAFCFVTAQQNQGWILDGICHEIARYCVEKCSFVYYPTPLLPEARTYFLSHFSLVRKCFSRFPWLPDRQVFVFFTHPPGGEPIDSKTLASLQQVSQVICQSSQSAQWLVQQGLSPDRVTYVLGGADPQLFLPHRRGEGVVGFSTSFYPRKAPERVVSIIEAMPHRQFLLLGRDWHTYDGFAALQDRPNFTYLEADYVDYPTYYQQIDVFVSPAYLEGGPIPLIETMMCNAVPVASDTGFAADLIRHGENGFIFDVDSPVERICQLIDAAYALAGDIRQTVVDYSWHNFSKQIQQMQQGRLAELEQKVPQLRSALDQAEKELVEARQALRSVNRELGAIKSSKFWPVWQTYERAKQRLGIGK
ncbi:MAG: glycosyltransferase [Cyanobacteria bacterium J06554_6]